MGVLWLLLGLALVVRVGLLVWLPEVNYDEAVNGLMGRHVLRGEFPIFYWGQDYAGTVEAFLVAVPFALLGSSVLTLRLVPLAFSLLSVVLASRLAREAYDVPTGRLAMLYAAVPPLTVLYYGETSMGPYPAAQVLGPVVLLLAIRLAEAPRVEAARALVLGLTAGLAWWTLFLLVAYVAAAGLYLLGRRPWRRLPVEATLVLVGFLLGSLPFWVYNLVLEPGASFALAQGASAAFARGTLVTVFRDALPAFLGGSTPWPSAGLNRAVLVGIWLVYVPAGAFVVYDGIQALRGQRASRAGTLLVLAAVSVFLAVVASEHGRLGGARYLVPLYGVLPALLARFTLAAQTAFGTGAAALLALAVVGLHGQELARDFLNSFRPRYLDEQGRPPTRTLADFLASQGIAHAYAHFRISLRLTFDTGEAIVASDWYGFRNLRYLEAVARAPRAALVAHRTLKLPDPDTLEANLRALGGSFQKREVDGFVVFYGFHPPSSTRPIPARGWVGRGSPRGEGASLAYDRDGATWWGSGESQRPGLAFEVDLGGLYRLTGLSLHPGPVPRGAPRGYRVEVSRDGTRWSEVVRVDEVLAGLHWANGHPELDRTGRVQAAFPPAEARHLRITQTGQDRYFWWSVGELFLYEDAPRLGDRSPASAALAEGRRLEALARWDYVGASPLARTQWRFRRGTDWARVLAAYARAVRGDPELEEAHHRLARVLSRLGVPPQKWADATGG